MDRGRDVWDCRVVSYRTGFGWSLSGEMSSTAAKSALVRSFPLQQLFTLTFSLESFSTFRKQHGTAYG